MRKRVVCILCGCIFLFGLAGCGGPEKAADATMLAGVEYLYDITWEDLEYTADLPVPTGTINYAMRNEAERWCSVFIEGMSEVEYKEYMSSLYEQGFNTVATESEEIKGESYVAVGTVLSNGTIGLSISYADEVLGIYINWGEK